MITRKELVEILNKWANGELSELQVWQWGENAQARSASGEDTCECELVRDLVSLIATLPYEMLVLKDVPVFLDALANPLDETDLSINLLWNHMDTVDVDTRRIQYGEHEFYGKFLEAD